ncbi:Fc.00g052950.m01.CDS01 [Cosmosporella sp. VM-42]
MTTLSSGLRRLRCPGQLNRSQWPQLALLRPNFQLAIRTISTESTSTETLDPERAAMVEAVKIPFQGITHARTVPATPSYFSREPHFNDMYIRISKLLTQYHHLPTLPPSEAPLTSWIRLQEMRSNLGEPIKASHYAKVLRVAKRLNIIEPSLLPEQVKAALSEFKRDINPFLNKPKPIPIDNFGRAVGVGKRKESTARAWVVEGTGEVLINGKPLNKAFGRVHDRESAVWALQATERLDKYNVWALVEGGGTTGQAEALTLAVAKALVAHEPALKTALRKAGCITRDPRTVERKKHGHVKARKMPAWVKR